MQLEAIRDAVQYLRDRGARVTVRSVHGLTGGSLRDVHRLLREALPGGAEVTDDVLPQPSPLDLARQAFHTADSARRSAQFEYQRVLEAYRGLRAQVPSPPAGDLGSIADQARAFRALQAAQQEAVAQAAAELALLEGVLKAREAEALRCQQAYEGLTARVRAIKSELPRAHAMLSHIRQVAAEQISEASRVIDIWRAKENEAEHAITRLQHELEALVGE